MCEACEMLVLCVLKAIEIQAVLFKSCFIVVP